MPSLQIQAPDLPRPDSDGTQGSSPAGATHAEPLTRANLRTPKAAAIAGMVFSVLLVVVFSLLRISLPADPQEPGAWLKTDSNTVALALNLVPFAGIAFLWFIGVLRDRLGELADHFFATVFFGSALLFLGMLFTAAAIVGSIIIAFTAAPEQLIRSATYHFARAAAYNIVNIYMIKMAAVFMISTSTVAIYTEFAPRWLALLGYALSLLLLFCSYYISWSFLVFPLWVFLISTYILVDGIRPEVRVAHQRND
jgi:MFS family permease